MLAHSMVTWYNTDTKKHTFSRMIASPDSFLLHKNQNSPKEIRMEIPWGCCYKVLLESGGCFISVRKTMPEQTAEASKWRAGW